MCTTAVWPPAMVQGLQAAPRPFCAQPRTCAAHGGVHEPAVVHCESRHLRRRPAKHVTVRERPKTNQDGPHPNAGSKRPSRHPWFRPAPAHPSPSPSAHLVVCGVPGSPLPLHPQLRAQHGGPRLAAGVRHRHVVVAAEDQRGQACRVGARRGRAGRAWIGRAGWVWRGRPPSAAAAALPCLAARPRRPVLQLTHPAR